MNNYCVDLDLDLPIFESELTPVEFLKQHYKFEKHFQIDVNHVSNKLKLMLAARGLSVLLVEIFYRRPNAVSYIHSDKGEFGRLIGDYAKLNWVYGGDGSVMNWYNINKNCVPKEENTAIDSYALYYEESQVEMIHSQKVNRPSLVQVGCPHRVVNGPTERICVSLVFVYDDDKRKRVTFQDAKTLFSEFIKIDSIG
jgi:hypothetical protein